MPMCFVFAVSFRTRVENQESFGQIKDKEPRDDQYKNGARAPSAFLGDANRFRKQVKENGAQQNPSAKAKQQMNAALRPYRNVAASQRGNHRKRGQQDNKHLG